MSEIRGFFFAVFRPGRGVFLLVPLPGAAEDPVRHLLCAFTGLGGDEEDLDGGVSHPCVLHHLFPVEVEIRLHIHLVDHQQLAGFIPCCGLERLFTLWD